MYWAASQPYHAFGLGASSLVGARRFARPRSMRAYRAWVEGFLAAGGGVPGARLNLRLPEHGHEGLGFRAKILQILVAQHALFVCVDCKSMWRFTHAGQSIWEMLWEMQRCVHAC